MSNDVTANDWRDHDDAPELTDEWFERADLKLGDEVLRPGRRAGEAKLAISLRVDAAVLAKWRETGPGWQSRMNEVLRRAIGL